jgi:hypothetical protein
MYQAAGQQGRLFAYHAETLCYFVSLALRYWPVGNRSLGHDELLQAVQWTVYCYSFHDEPTSIQFAIS